MTQKCQLLEFLIHVPGIDFLFCIVLRVIKNGETGHGYTHFHISAEFINLHRSLPEFS